MWSKYTSKQTAVEKQQETNACSNKGGGGNMQKKEVKKHISDMNLQ